MADSLFGSYLIDDPDNIKANRDGHITAEQRAVFGSKLILLDMMIGSFKGWLVKIFLVFFVFVVGITAIGGLPMLKVHQETWLWVLFATVFLLLIGVTFWHLVIPWHQWRLLQKELRDDAIATTEGELHFGKKGFHIPASGGSRKIQHGDLTDLEPGITYRIYYLPKSRVLLSAEAVEPITPSAVTEGLTTILAEANGFDLGALPMNRRGKLAPGQMSRLYRETFFRLLALAVVGSVAAFWFIRLGGGDRSMVAYVLDLILLGLMAFFGYYLLRVVWDMLRKQVISVEGIGEKKVEITSDDDGEQRTYYYIIGGQSFVVSSRGFDALREGWRYRAYFTPKGRLLVNIEALEKAR